MRFLFYLFLLTSVFSSNYAMRASVRPTRPSEAMRIAKRVDHHHTKLVNTQHELIRILGKIPPSKFKPRHIEPITRAIALQNAHPRLKKHEQLIHQSIGKFLKTPGFLHTLQQLFCHAITDPNSFKGSLYELEQALEIAESENGEIVVGINQQLSCPAKILKKQFDICTNWRLIECKNIKWPTYPAHAHYLRSQFEQQQNIVLLLNAQREQELYLEVRSKERIPNSWCQWFEDHGIRYSW